MRRLLKRIGDIVFGRPTIGDEDERRWVLQKREEVHDRLTRIKSEVEAELWQTG